MLEQPHMAACSAALPHSATQPPQLSRPRSLLRLSLLLQAATSRPIPASPSRSDHPRYDSFFPIFSFHCELTLLFVFYSFLPRVFTNLLLLFFKISIFCCLIYFLLLLLLLLLSNHVQCVCVIVCACMCVCLLAGHTSTEASSCQPGQCGGPSMYTPLLTHHLFIQCGIKVLALRQVLVGYRVIIRL